MMKLVVFSLCIAILTSCATIFNGSKARVVLADEKVTDPVDLTVDGAKYPNILLPARVKIKRGFKDTKVVAEARGYNSSSVDIHKKFNGTTLWNIILGGIPGMAVDAATGAMMKPESNYYNLNMQPATLKNYVEDPTIMAGEASNMVSRDKPGQTALERTVIRWYFDSAYLLACGFEHSGRRQKHERNLSDDHPVRRDPLVQHFRTDLRKLPGRADRDQSKQKRLRRPGQTLQCPTGNRPTGDKRIF